MQKILGNINEPNDIKNIDKNDLPRLAEEIRKFLVKNVSQTGGHLSSNLGAVELTMALHLCMNFPEDKLIFDVGHQAYTHKILTGRRKEFDSLRTLGGICGFPKIEESDCDAFSAGHSSTSISAALGYAKARDMLGQNYKVCAVLGDGALTGGMAYEALNNAARLKSNMVIVLNDNNMSISENVGGMASYLGKVRTASSYNDFKGNVKSAVSKLPVIGDKLAKTLKQSKDSLKRLVIPGMLFEDMGITYIGPIDGHDIELLAKAFKTAFSAKEPVMVHVVTKKGNGYKYAEKDSSKFHGIDPFDPQTGELLNDNKAIGYTDIFANKLTSMASEDKSIVAITAAMPTGTGLDLFHDEFPNRLFDVGIAEEHAVTYAAGLASGGLTPVVCIYSTFLQRAYDQILHDVCLTNRHVIFGIDRAGIVGRDGATHQGIFDISYMTSMPNMVVACPANDKELEKMLELGVAYDGPFAIRYPRGAARSVDGINAYDGFTHGKLSLGKADVVHSSTDNSKIAICYIGSTEDRALDLYERLKKDGKDASVINLRFAKPLDISMLEIIADNNDIVITIEENVKSGGVGEKVASYISCKGYKCQCVIGALNDEFIEHGDRDKLLDIYGLNVEKLYDKVKKIMR